LLVTILRLGKGQLRMGKREGCFFLRIRYNPRQARACCSANTLFCPLGHVFKALIRERCRCTAWLFF
jgi:hypothetical protein